LRSTTRHGERLARAQTLGTRIAYALDSGDKQKAEDLGWELNAEIYPIVMYGTVFHYYTTELRDVTEKITARLTMIRMFWEEPERAANEIDAEGALHYWRLGAGSGVALLNALEKEFEHMA